MKFTPLTLALALSFACAAAREPEPTPEPQVQPELQPQTELESASLAEPLHVIVLHTNDVHGQVLPRPATWISREDPPDSGGLARVAAYIQSVRNEALESGAEVLVLDGGDWSQGTPEGQIERGRAFVRALQLIGYDAMSLGNHEFDHGLAPLRELLEEIELPAVCANLTDRESGLPVDWIEPVRVLQVADMSVAVVGLLTPETAVITHADARTLIGYEEPAASLARIRDSWTGPKIDWWIPVTHIGIESDMALAEAHPDLPLIVGGHTHRFVPRGLRVDDTLVVQAGAKASVVGRVDLHFAANTRELKSSQARLIDLLEEPTEHRNVHVDEACAALLARSAARLNEVVGRLDARLEGSRDRYTSSGSGNLIAAVTRRVLDADIGLMNRGGIRKSLEPGDVTRRDLFELCPFDNYTVSFEMRRAELMAMLKIAVEDLDHSGVEIDGAELVVEKGSLVDILVDGESLSETAVVEVALNSFMATGGDGYLDQELSATLPRSEDPRFLRELLEEYFVTYETHTPDTTNRYRVTR